MTDSQPMNEPAGRTVKTHGIYDHVEFIAPVGCLEKQHVSGKRERYHLTVIRIGSARIPVYIYGAYDRITRNAETRLIGQVRVCEQMVNDAPMIIVTFTAYSAESSRDQKPRCHLAFGNLSACSLAWLPVPGTTGHVMINPRRKLKPSFAKISTIEAPEQIAA
jgi:hypothetical protein